MREISVREITVREIRVSEIRISSNHRELHGAIFSDYSVRGDAVPTPPPLVTDTDTDTDTQTGRQQVSKCQRSR